MDRIEVARSLAAVFAAAALLGFAEPSLDGVLRGRVLSGVDSSALSNARVSVERGGLRLDGVTDENGAFIVSPIPAGTYALVVRALSYPVFRDSFQISDGDTVAKTIVMTSHCEFDSIAAERDIASGVPKILLYGAISTPFDDELQRRYDFQYLDRGDIVTQPFECDTQYNRVVFRYLDRKFGRGWRDSVRTP